MNTTWHMYYLNPGIILGAVALLFIILAFIFWFWMIIDCITHEKGTPLIGWLILIVFAHGIGALIYYLVKKVPRGAG